MSLAAENTTPTSSSTTSTVPQARASPVPVGNFESRCLNHKNPAPPPHNLPWQWAGQEDVGGEGPQVPEELQNLHGRLLPPRPLAAGEGGQPDGRAG